VLNSVDEKNDYQDKYLAYATKEKVVGIIKLPLDGNPNNTIGLIAHSNKITSINSTVDGKLFFTSGADDFCVNIWEVDFSALEENFSGTAYFIQWRPMRIHFLNC
jgi:WD40 repeat protein